MAHNNTSALRAFSPARLLGSLIHGRVISSDIFKRHWGVVATVLMFVMLYITNKYYCQTSMEQVAALKRELEIVSTESVRAKSRYMSRTREFAMQQMIDSLNLGLNVQTKPPYVIGQ